MTTDTGETRLPTAPSVPLAEVALVVNGASRRGRTALGAVQERLLAAGAGTVRAFPAEDGAGLGAALDRALETQPDLLVVGGGDGTIGAAAGLVAGTDTVLGVLALGTANDFARTLEIPAAGTPAGSRPPWTPSWPVAWSTSTSAAPDPARSSTSPPWASRSPSPHG
jgi:hypothetical protein